MIKKIAGRVSVSILLAVIVLGLLLVWRLNSQNNAEPHQAIELVNVISDACFSPNNDGVKDLMAFKAIFQGPPNKPVFATLFVKKNNELLNFRIGTAMLSNAGTAEINMNWNGKDWHGQNVTDGKYSLLLYYFDIPGLYNQLANQKIEKVLDKIEKRLLQREKQEVLKRWDGEVEVDNGKPVLTVTNPAANVSTYDATWPSEGDVEGAETLTINNSAVIIDNNHFASLLNLQPGTNIFTYLAEDCAGNRDQQIRTIERLVDTTPPTISISSPKENEKYTALPLAIAAAWEDNGSGIALPALKILLNGSDITSSLTVTDNGASGNIDDESLLSDGANTLRLEVSDQAGNQGTASVHFNFEKIAVKDKTFIYGRVFNMTDNNPLGGALITAAGNTAQSDGQGNWRLMFGEGGTYKIEISKPGFTAVYRKISVAKGKEAVSEDAYLTPLDSKVTPIGPEGGTHSNSDGTVEIVVPSGALSETKNIQSTRLAGSKALPGDLNATDNLKYPISFLFCADLMPDGTVFAQPVKLRVKNTWGFAAGTQIPFAYWDTNALKWVPEGMAKVNVDKTWLEAEVSHFTRYDINNPADIPRFGGFPIFTFNPPPENPDCNIGSSVDVNTGSLQTDIALPGIKVRGGDTGITLVYNSATAFPTTVLSVLNYHNNSLVLKPDRTEMKVNSPLLSGGGSGGSAAVKALNFKAPALYGSGALIFSGVYPSGRTVQTGYQKINLDFTNYYPGIYALTAIWGGMPTGSTGIISTEPAYLEDKNEEKFFMVSRVESPFGKGWNLANLKKLYFEDNRVVVVDGDGGYREYEYGVNYAEKLNGASVKTTSHRMLDAENMLSDHVLNTYKKENCARFYLAVGSGEINQIFIIDLGQEREINKIGIDFPTYWDQRNIWDFIRISTSVDNIEYREWGQYGEPTLKDPAQGIDPLDYWIKSPYFISKAGQPVRYIKYELGFPSVALLGGYAGSGIYRVYAIGSENTLQPIDKQKWPKLYLDQPSGNYILEEYSGSQTVFSNDGRMIAEKERSGRTVNYEYNGDRLIRISYPENVFMEFNYNAGGRLEKIKDAGGRETTINMDQEGNLLEVVYADSETRQFTYDERGLLLSDKKGPAEKKYTWDDRYPVLTEVELPNHGKRVLEPWALKNVLNDKESSPQNLLDFPFLDNVLKSPKYMESLVTFEDGRQEKYATGNGLSWKYENDKLREKTTYADLERNLLPINIERGDSGWETSQISYNDDWQVMKILSDLRDNIWYEEDYNDNNAAPYYPGSSDWNMHISGTTIEYNEQRLVAKVTKSSRDIQTFTYDANGRVIEMENTYPQLGKLTKYDYNDDGDMIKVTYPDGKINEMTYNARGLVMEVKNNDGSKTTMERDSRGDVIAMTDEMNRRVELRRDIMGRVLQEKSPSGKEVEYQWGGAGCAACGDGSKLTRITDASDHVWEFKYDVMGNPLKMIYPDGSSITQEYDIAGRLKKFFNKRGQEISYNYDNFGKLLKKTTPGGDINFTYDVRDGISDITGSDFHYYYRYGNTNYSMRLVEEKDANSGNWNQQITNFFGLPDKTFDNFGWNKRYVYNFAITPVGPTPFNLIYSKRYISKHLQSFYTYDNGLRPVKKYDSTFDNEKYNYYDSNGLLRRIYYKSFSNPTLYSTGSLDFSRDTSGLIAGLTGDKQLNATYDSDLQINSIQHTLPRPFDESYTYDDNGNRLTSLNNSFTYDDLNRLTESASHNYEYDADGNMTSEKNKLTGETKKYYYNSENRMIKYEHLASDISPIDITAEYKYDIYGRRIQKNMNGAITSFTWEGDSLSMELNSSNQPIRKYFTENGMDEYIGHLEYSEVSDWTKIFDVWNNQGMYSYIKDQVGTVYKVWDHSTKQVADSRAYDSFGNLVNQTGTTKTPLGFQGKYYDAESGLNYFYHRYYNPAIGRFTSEDPIGFGGGMNFYGFVGNNPIGFFDLFGMEKSCHRITDWVPSTVMESAGNKGRLVRSFEQIQWSLQNQSNPAPFVSSQMPRGARTGQLIFSCRYVGSLIKTSIYEKLRLYEAKFECHDDCNSWTETQNKSQAEQYSKSIQEPTIGSLTKTRILWYPCPNFLVEDL